MWPSASLAGLNVRTARQSVAHSFVTLAPRATGVHVLSARTGVASLRDKCRTVVVSWLVAPHPPRCHPHGQREDANDNPNDELRCAREVGGHARFLSRLSFVLAVST